MSNPQRADDYDDRGARAANNVLVELGQVLGTYRDAFVIIGGLVPGLHIPGKGHIGSLDVDIQLDTDKLADHGYADLLESLEAAGYEHRTRDLKPFQFRRVVDLRDGGEPVSVIVDVLMPKGAKTRKNKPKLIEGFRAQEADGGEIALRYNIKLEISGLMPDRRPNKVTMLVASIPALLVMKGYALAQRDKKKDAYDIYFSIRNFSGGPDALADACRPLLNEDVARQGFAHIAGKFDSLDAFGPVTVRMFMQDAPDPEGMTPDQLQQDAFQQVHALMQRLGFAS
jgi:hypothetical protein